MKKKTIITTLSEKFKNQISKSMKQAKTTPLSQKYTTAYFAALLQVLQLKEVLFNLHFVQYIKMVTNHKPLKRVCC